MEKFSTLHEFPKTSIGTISYRGRVGSMIRLIIDQLFLQEADLE